MKMKKRLLAFAIPLILGVGIADSPIFAEAITHGGIEKEVNTDETDVDMQEPEILPFVDVFKEKWYYNSVEWAYTNGLLVGTSDTTFSPNEPMTRGMLVTVLYRMEGRPIVLEENKFPDVSETKYYASAITWASSMNLVSGYTNGKFGPEDSITREQIAKILYQYAKYKGDDVSASKELNDFFDASDVSDYAKKYVKWTVAVGLIQGSDGELNPKGEATRAEIAAILRRFVEHLKTDDEDAENEHESETETEIEDETENETEIPEPSVPETEHPHQHNWVEMTHQEDHGWYELVGERTIGYSCNGCGAVFASKDAYYTHAESEMSENDLSHGSFMILTEPIYEWVENLVTVTDGYKCECGAIKEDVESEPEPPHQHTWVEVTHQEDHGWYEFVGERTIGYSCNGCGAVFASKDAYEAHDKSMIAANDFSHGSWMILTEPIYEWVENLVTVTDGYKCECGAIKEDVESEPGAPHEHIWVEMTHQEDHGWYELVGERTIGYSCNGCGAVFASKDAYKAHNESMVAANNFSHGSWMILTEPIYEWVENLVTVTDGYKCECGAIKEDVEAEPEPPHQHTWVEVTHQENYPYQDIVGWQAICNGCKEDITGDPWGHCNEQMLEGNMDCGGYTKYPVYGYVDNWVTVSDGYVCACGATK